QAHLAAMLPVAAQLRETSMPAWTNGAGEPQPNIVQVKSGFYRLINRRYQPRHFRPSEARTELDWKEPEPGARPAPSYRGYGPRYERIWRPLLTSARARWWVIEGGHPDFDEDGLKTCQVDLVGVDVSSSGTQILAVLLGLEELEQHASSTEPRFKRFLAKHAWDTLTPPTRARYEGPDDAKLIEAVKQFWMKVMYGASPKTPKPGSTKARPLVPAAHAVVQPSRHDRPRRQGNLRLPEASRPSGPARAAVRPGGRDASRTLCAVPTAT